MSERTLATIDSLWVGLELNSLSLILEQTNTWSQTHIPDGFSSHSGQKSGI
jgi:hypothetical protein